MSGLLASRYFFVPTDTTVLLYLHVHLSMCEYQLSSSSSSYILVYFKDSCLHLLLLYFSRLYSRCGNTKSYTRDNFHETTCHVHFCFLFVRQSRYHKLSSMIFNGETERIVTDICRRNA